MLAGAAEYQRVCAAAAAGFGPLGVGELSRGDSGAPVLVRRWAEGQGRATGAGSAAPGRPLELAAACAARGLERREGDGLKALHMFLGAALSEWRSNSEPARLGLALQRLGPALCTLSGIGEAGLHGVRRVCIGDAVAFWGGIRAILHTRFSTAAPPGQSQVLAQLAMLALGWLPDDSDSVAAAPAWEKFFPIVNVCLGLSGSLASSQVVDGLVLHGDVGRGYGGGAYASGCCRVAILKHTDVGFGGQILMAARDSEGLQEALAMEERAALAVTQTLKAAGATVVVTSWTPPAVLGQHAALLGILLLHSVPEAEVGALGVALGVEALGFSALARCKPAHLSVDVKIQRLQCGKNILHHFLVPPSTAIGTSPQARTILLMSPTSQQCQLLKSLVLSGISAVKRALQPSDFSHLDISPGAGALELSLARTIEGWLEPLQSGISGISEEADALVLLSRQNGIPSALAVRVLRMVQAGILAGPRAILKSAAPKAQSIHILGDSVLSPSREDFGGLVITAACDPTLRDVLASTSEPRVHIGGVEVTYPLVHGVAECSKFKRAWVESAVETLTQIVRVDGCIFSSVRLKIPPEDGPGRDSDE